LRLHDARHFGGKKNWEQEKKMSKKKIEQRKKSWEPKSCFFEQIKFLGARRQHMAKGVGLFFTLSFCSSVYSVYLKRGRGFVQGMLNLTYQVLAKGLIRHHLCCYKLRGVTLMRIVMIKKEVSMNKNMVLSILPEVLMRGAAKLKCERSDTRRSSAKKNGCLSLTVTLAPKMSRRQTLNAS
jgi:hypothetical protein